MKKPADRHSRQIHLPKSVLRHSFRLLITICFFMLAYCGGGGGGGGSHAPIISNLNYSPKSAFVNGGGGTITISGTFDFSDEGGDITSIRITTFDASGSITNDISSPIQGISGIKTGTIFGQILVGTTDAGVYTFKIYIEDAQGSSSNVLEGIFPINYPPTSGPIVHEPGYSISLVATGLGAADGVAIGPTGDLFVVDNQGGRILKVDHLTYVVSVYATGLFSPPDLTFDSVGRLLVISGNSNILQVFSNGSTSIFSAGPFSYATGIAAASNGELFVSNSGNGTISRVSSTGVSQTYLSGYSTPNGPFGVSLDGLGNLFFVDHGTGRVFKSDQAKNVSRLANLVPLGPAFTEAGPGGDLYVSDSLNAVIYRISGGTVSVFASGFTGKSSPPVIGPTGMEFDLTGNMYVADGDKLWKISHVVPFEVTYNFTGGFHIYGWPPVPQTNGFDYYFTPLILDSSLAGQRVRVNSISVSVPATSTGDVVNWDWEIHLGSSPFGFPEGQFVATLVDPVGGYVRNSPTRLQFNEGIFFPANPTDFVFSANYDYNTATLSGNPAPYNLKSAIRSEMNLANGLYAQMFFWTADNRNCYITFGGGTLTIKGEIVP